MESMRYLAPNQTHWHGRADSPSEACIFNIIHLLNLQDSMLPTHSGLAFGLLGFCCDEGIKRNLGRQGAAEGPAAIRAQLAKLPSPTQPVTCYDAGDILCPDGDLESAQNALSDAVAILQKHQITPIVLGGGHELALGHYQGIAKVFPKQNLGIINFDAHFDMRPLLANDMGSSGTPFLQIAKEHAKNERRFNYNCIGIQHAGNIKELFTTANKYNTNIIYAENLHLSQTDICQTFIKRILNQNDIVYVSLCLDVFATPFAPGVSAPQTLGLTPWQVIPYIRQLASSAKVVSYDIAELSPPYDIDQRTAKLAANLIYEIMCHHQPYKQKKEE